MASSVNAALDQLMRSYYSDDDESVPLPETSTPRMTSTSNASPTRGDTLDLWKEVRRYKALKQVHARLESICETYVGEAFMSRLPLHSKVTLRNGDALFEQFLFAVLSQQETWFPPAAVFLSTGLAFLQTELESYARSKEEKRGVEQAMNQFRPAMRRELTAKLPLPPRVQNVHFHQGSLRFAKLRIRVSNRQRRRLERLYIATNTANDAQFHRHLFALLLRYRTLGGPGLQAAIPDQVFRVIREELAVDCELFASPLNCTCPRYCSAFPDVDRVFGSLGSCFDYLPDTGSFQANPPFAQGVVHRMFQHFAGLLQKSEQPLSFTCIVPQRFDEFVRKHVDASYITSYQVLLNRQHYYIQGNRNVDGKLKKVKSTCDTAVYVLQNSSGSAAWPVLDTFRDKITAAFQLAAG